MRKQMEQRQAKSKKNMKIFTDQVSETQDQSPSLSYPKNEGEGESQEPMSADLKESDQVNVELEDVENLIKKETKHVQFDGEDFVVTQATGEIEDAQVL